GAGAPVGRVGDVTDGSHAELLHHQGEEAVVRREEELPVLGGEEDGPPLGSHPGVDHRHEGGSRRELPGRQQEGDGPFPHVIGLNLDRKSTRLNSSHVKTSYAVFCLKKKSIAPMRTATLAAIKTATTSSAAGTPALED